MEKRKGIFEDKERKKWERKRHVLELASYADCLE